jgi:hypothetical protein
MSKVKYGKLDDPSTHSIPDNSWLDFHFTQFDEPKQVFDGGAITLYVDGKGGYCCHGHRAETPSLQMYQRGEEGEEVLDWPTEQEESSKGETRVHVAREDVPVPT